jgi:hypothetical protein
MVAIPKKIIYVHIRTRDVAHDVAGLGTRSDFLQQNFLKFLPKFRVVNVSVKRFLA